MNAMDWAASEFGDAQLGDLRRTDRLVRMSAKIISSPGCNLSEMMGSQADNKAAQRFFASDAFGYEDLVAPAIAQTIDCMPEKNRVYLIQDTSHLNYDSHTATLGLGHIGSTDDKSFQGLMMHWTLALSAKAECLGVAGLKLWQRAPEPRKKSPQAHQNVPIESKESYKWIEAVDYLDGLLPKDTQAVWIGDREADIYDFMHRIKSKKQDFVIRCNENRIIDDEEGLLKEKVRSQPRIGTQILSLKTLEGKDLRDLEVDIQCCEIPLVVQRRKGGAKSKHRCNDLEIHAVRVSSQQHEFEWILLTSLPVETLNDCLEIVWIYKQRWHIESVHKTLKSGFKAEKITLDSAQKLTKAIAVMLPCAVKVYELSQKQKHVPDQAADTVLSKIECMLLSKKNRKSATYVPTVKEAWYWIGLLGGFRGSKNSAPPGQMTFWRGFIHLRDMGLGAEMYRQLLEKEKCVH